MHILSWPLHSFIHYRKRSQRTGKSLVIRFKPEMRKLRKLYWRFHLLFLRNSVVIFYLHSIQKVLFFFEIYLFQLECYWSTIVLHLTQIHVNTFMILWWISFHLWRTSAGLAEHHSLVWLLSQALLRYGMIKFAFVLKFNLRELVQSRKKILILY